MHDVKSNKIKLNETEFCMGKNEKFFLFDFVIIKQ